MRPDRWVWMTALALTIVPAVPGWAEGPAATRRLAERLLASGRAEARLTQTVLAAGETLRADRGRLTLEKPDRMRLDFTRSGERLTVRGDGGEWLQPAARQLLVLRAEQALAAVGLWQILLDGRDDAFSERSLGGGRYRLVARGRDAGLPDSIVVKLGPDRLPRRLDAWMGDQRFVLALSGWSFSRPRGRAAFVLRAPPGYAVLEAP
jgi:hypothetical protein